MDERVGRIAKNQAHFRAINEHLEETATTFTRLEEQQYEFLCECANRDCARPIALALEQYEQVRSNPRRFAVAAGHELGEDVETVVDELPGFVFVIEKRGDAAAVAEDTDPRQRPSREPGVRGRR
jgi:hypothetical protein